MEPAEYREFLGKVELQVIVLDSCSVKTNRDNLGGDMKLFINHNVKYTIEEDTSAFISSSYDLIATQSTKKDFAMKAACNYRVVLSSEVPLKKDFLEIYTKLNVQMNTWPYFREFVQSMIQRIGFPPLTLPFLKQ